MVKVGLPACQVLGIQKIELVYQFGEAFTSFRGLN
jgi:hypothetical protein